MSRGTSWLFVSCLVGLAVSAVALVILMPSLFDENGTTPPWIIWSLSGLVLAFAIATRLLKPAPPSARERENR